MTPRRIETLALPGIPLVQPGDDLCDLILSALGRADVTLRRDDVIVVAQKIVSKAEGRYATLNDITPSAEAVALGAEVGHETGILSRSAAPCERGQAQPGELPRALQPSQAVLAADAAVSTRIAKRMPGKGETRMPTA